MLRNSSSIYRSAESALMCDLLNKSKCGPQAGTAQSACLGSNHASRAYRSAKKAIKNLSFSIHKLRQHVARWVDDYFHISFIICDALPVRLRQNTAKCMQSGEMNICTIILIDTSNNPRKAWSTSWNHKHKHQNQTALCHSPRKIYLARFHILPLFPSNLTPLSNSEQQQPSRWLNFFPVRLRFVAVLVAAEVAKKRKSEENVKPHISEKRKKCVCWFHPSNQ